MDPEDARRTAFWLNTYNSLLRARIRNAPLKGSVLRERRLFREVSVEVGGLSYSLDVIEHGLLRLNRRRPFGLRPLLDDGDPRLAAGPRALDPRIHFALNCGARSCPPVREYDAEGVDEQLEAATQGYLQAETDIDTEAGTVALPGLMRLYRRDFGDPYGFAAERLPELRGRRLKVGWTRFDWSAA